MSSFSFRYQILIVLEGGSSEMARNLNRFILENVDELRYGVFVSSWEKMVPMTD